MKQKPTKQTILIVEDDPQVMEVFSLMLEEGGYEVRRADSALPALLMAGGKLPEAEYEWVVDATGSAAGLRAAVRMTQPRGTVILKSTVHGEVAVDTAPVIVNEITLVGSRCGRMEPALELLQSGKIDVESMISGAVSLADAPGGFALAARPGVMKVLLRGA